MVTSSRSPFDFIKAINQGMDVLKDSIDEHEYAPFLTNLAFSLHSDTLFQANEMNIRPWLPGRMQFAFYRASIKPAKRWKSWPKKKKVSGDNVRLIQSVYKYNSTKAREALLVLNEDQIKWLQEKQEKGG